jgi:hypothetical protein
MLKQVYNFFSQVSRVMLYKLYLLNRYIARAIKRLTKEEMDYLYYQLDNYYNYYYPLTVWGGDLLISSV